MRRGQWLVAAIATALITVGVAGLTGAPGHAIKGGQRGPHVPAPQRVQLHWTNLGGHSTSSVAVASWSPDRMDVFIRGEDGALWQRTSENGKWSQWHSLGGSLLSGPAAVSWGPDRIDVFARGQDNGVSHIAWNGSRWSSWDTLGGIISSTPAVSSWASGRLDVFVPGQDGALWHR
ncbi:MAG TPA: hypothetical protein VFL27_02910, partial [Candidatus Dormibacteraeota bacterium]|nr:hypothetical protein [Candidatus Dormibacteraeota bacterium]